MDRNIMNRIASALGWITIFASPLAGVFQADSPRLRYLIQTLGNAGSVGITRSDDTDGYVFCLEYQLGSWARFNWPIFEPVPDSAEGDELRPPPDPLIEQWQRVNDLVRRWDAEHQRLQRQSEQTDLWLQELNRLIADGATSAGQRHALERLAHQAMPWQQPPETPQALTETPAISMDAYRDLVQVRQTPPVSLIELSADTKLSQSLLYAAPQQLSPTFVTIDGVHAVRHEIQFSDADAQQVVFTVLPFPDPVDLEGQRIRMRCTARSLNVQTLARDPEGRAVIVQRPYGQGRVTLLGTSIGAAIEVHRRVTRSGATHPLYDRDTASGLERLSRVVVNLCRVGWQAEQYRPRLYVRVTPETTWVPAGAPVRPTMTLTGVEGQPVAGQLRARVRTMGMHRNAGSCSGFIDLKAYSPNHIPAHAATTVLLAPRPRLPRGWAYGSKEGASKATGRKP